MACRRQGFSLLEILIVVTMLAIIAAMVVPRFMDASNTARDSALETDLQMLRRQIQLYRLQHGGKGPHLDSAGKLDTGNLVTRLTGRTNAAGDLDAAGSCGPYMNEWPTNPYAASGVAEDVAFGTSETPPRDGKTGWYYCTATCLISPNTAIGAKQFDAGLSGTVGELPPSLRP